MKLLVVDDDRDLVELLDYALRREGYEVVRAYDGEAALETLNRERPDLVVLDINLGGSSGLEVLREVRRRWRLPVIMLTALDSEEDKVRGLESGADDYLTKPFSHRELIARIRAQLRRSGQEWPATFGALPVAARWHPAAGSSRMEGRSNPRRSR